MPGACNKCHQALDFGFNVITRPTSNPVSNQAFAKHQSEPRGLTRGRSRRAAVRWPGGRAAYGTSKRHGVTPAAGCGSSTSTFLAAVAPRRLRETEGGSQLNLKPLAGPKHRSRETSGKKDHKPLSKAFRSDFPREPEHDRLEASLAREHDDNRAACCWS